MKFKNLYSADWSKYALTPQHLREHETLQTGDWVRIHGRVRLNASFTSHIYKEFQSMFIYFKIDIAIEWLGRLASC